MKLELKHLAPYLPYGLEVMTESEVNSKEPNITKLKSIDIVVNMINFGHGNALESNEFKPILRPLSDLTKDIEVNGEKFVPNYELDKLPNCIQLRHPVYLNSYNIVQKLFEWHFDVFGLIKEGLAIDINTLQS